MLRRRGGTRPSSALRLLRPGPSRPHAHSVRACGRPVGQRLPFDARAVCLPPVAAVAPVSAPSGDDACCSATALHGSGLSSGAPVAAATSAGVMRAHFGARYTWPRRCCAGCRTAVADHIQGSMIHHQGPRISFEFHGPRRPLAAPARLPKPPGASPDVMAA